MSVKIPDSSEQSPRTPLINISSREDTIQRKLEAERARLAREMGIDVRPRQHFARPVERLFTADQRAHTTLLYGGLTWKHERLVHGVMEGLGYRPEALPVPDVAAFQLGKEYGNNGQCNPTYFTVGNLVQYLQYLERSGLSRDEIQDNYVFITAGGCGPCRFGMYEAEYRLALRNSGFDRFRVLIFQQSGNFNQSEAKAGLELNMDFFLALLNALNMGDMLNDVGYQIRPFEVTPGETESALAEAAEYLHDVFRDHRTFSVERTLGGVLKNLPAVAGATDYLGKFVEQLLSREYTDAFASVGERLAKIRVDRTRPKPIVKVTGEFWAKTTEGDGNFKMYPFLEREGAQVMVDPIGTWITYLLHQAKQEVVDRAGVTDSEAMPAPWRVDKRIKNSLDVRTTLAKISVAEMILKREWNRLRDALKGVPHALVDQYELQRIAHPLYNTRAEGGEGHLEVAKNIYYANKDLAHMVLSLKPFGCMPSTQSDGVQSAVINHYKDMIFLPVETSGEGEINAHSRVQMALGEAKTKMKAELARVLDEAGLTLDQVRDYASDHPELEGGLYKVPRHKGVIGTAANFVMHVAELMNRNRRSRVAAH